MLDFDSLLRESPAAGVELVVGEHAVGRIERATRSVERELPVVGDHIELHERRIRPTRSDRLGALPQN